MAISTKLSAVMLLLIAIFSVLNLSAALPVTTDLVSTQRCQTKNTVLANNMQAVHDCVHANGGSGCTTFDNTASTPNVKNTNDNTLDAFHHDLTKLKRNLPDGTTLDCDDITAPLSKDAVRSNFVEKYCGRIDGEVFRKSGIEEVCTELITTMYMFVSTINGDWVSEVQPQEIVPGADHMQVYVNEKDRCISTFDVIINSCSDDKTFGKFDDQTRKFS
jgi:hypothetical protein